MGADFLSGSICTLFFVVALFLLKFWRRTRDNLFLSFSAAFLLLGIERMLIVFLVGRTTISYVYVVRLLAFLLIIQAFIRKNRD
ncbi:MAG: DUF5985 family protein [Verrucomicrobiota bacterium]